MDRRVTSPKRVTSPTWGSPTPCKQAFSRRCTTTTWKCLISRFVEDVNTRQQLSYSFPGLWYCPLEFHSKKSCQHLTNYTRWNKRDKVWSSANSLFKWRFRSRRRYRCLSSLLLQHKQWTILQPHLNSVCLLGFGKTIWCPLYKRRFYPFL